MAQISYKAVRSAVGHTEVTGSINALAELIQHPLPVGSLRALLRSALRWRVVDQQLIKHVFVLMLENRSFDHLFGYTAISGFDADTGAVTEINDLSKQSYSNRYVPDIGITVPTARSTPPHHKFSLIDGDPPHEFEDVLIQLCGPGNYLVNNKLPGERHPDLKGPDDTGFVASYSQIGPPNEARVMQGFGQGDLPALQALATNFAILDSWFASIPGPTWPNRFFVHAASSGGLDNSPDGWHVVKSGPLPLDKYKFTNGTIYDLLYAAGLKFRVYHGDNCPVVGAIQPKQDVLDFDDVFFDFEELPTALASGYDAVYTFIEPNYGMIFPTSTFEGGKFDASHR